MRALGFWDTLEERGASDLGLALVSEEKKSLILETLGNLFGAGKREIWINTLREADIVAAPINTLLEASNDPDVMQNGYITEVEYPDLGEKLKVHGSPWNFSETPASVGRAPLLGQPTAEILESLGFNKKKISMLKRKKII